MAYGVTFKPSALKEIGKLPQQLGKRVFAKAELLGSDPRPSGCLKLSGGGNLWRVRVGDYRIVYTIDDGSRIVDVRLVAHRRDVYRGI